MAMTYQQQYVLDGAAGRDAILNLTARHNRCYSDGDRNGWIATFRHSGARFTRDGEEFTDLRAAFDGGNGRLVTVDHEITVDGVNATQRCVALLFAAGARRRHHACVPPEATAINSSTSVAAGTSLPASSNGIRCRTGIRSRCDGSGRLSTAHQLPAGVRYLRGRAADGRCGDRAENSRGRWSVRRGSRCSPPQYATAIRHIGMPSSRRRPGEGCWRRRGC